jgi:hypothetical protein
MYTFLTTYYSSASKHAASSTIFGGFNNGSGTVFNEESAIFGGNNNQVYESSITVADNGFSTYVTQNNANGGSFQAEVLTWSEGGSGLYLLSYEMETHSDRPYSIYIGTWNALQYGSGDRTVFPVTYEGFGFNLTFRISHFGNYTTGDADGLSTGWSEDNTDPAGVVGTYKAFPDIASPFTTYTAPSFITESTIISIKTTTQIDGSYTFLGTAYTAPSTVETTATTSIEYQSTTSTTTDVHHHIGTSIDTNNSDFTLITDLNSRGEQISPFACLLSAPESAYILPENISTYSQTLLIPPDPVFVPLLAQTFAPQVLPVGGNISNIVRVPSATITIQYTDLTELSETQKRILDYIYDGNTGSFDTEEAFFSERSTVSYESILVSLSYSAAGTNYTSLRNTLLSVPSSTTRSLVLAGQRGILSTSIQFETLTIAIPSYQSAGRVIAAIGASYTTSTYATASTEEENLKTRATNENGRRQGVYSETLGQFQSTKPYINDLLFGPASETVYNGTVVNAENWAGRGNIYFNYGVTDYAPSFTEQPKIYYYKNRITYNASNLLKNNGIFSILNSKAYKDYEFPAIGIGDTFSSIVRQPTNTDETLQTTFTRKILAGVQDIYDPSVATFVLPESSSITDTSFTAYTTWAVAYSNPSVTRIMPNGSSTTISRDVGFSAEYFMGYNDNRNLFGFPYVLFFSNNNTIVSPIGSVSNLPDYLVIDAPTTFTGKSDDIYITSFRKTYYATSIATSNNSTQTFTTTYSEGAFSSNGVLVLRSSGLYQRQDGADTFGAGINFLGGYMLDMLNTEFNPDIESRSRTTRFWDTGQSSTNTIFNFTSYVGSTYIDV